MPLNKGTFASNLEPLIYNAFISLQSGGDPEQVAIGQSRLRQLSRDLAKAIADESDTFVKGGLVTTSDAQGGTNTGAIT